MKFARYVYWFEALVLDLLTGLFTLFAPGTFVASFTSVTVAPLPLEFIRWYGVLLIVFAYFFVRALLGTNRHSLKLLIEGFLLGDLLHMVAVALFVRAGAGFTAPVIFMTFTTVALAIIRTV